MLLNICHLLYLVKNISTASLAWWDQVFRKFIWDFVSSQLNLDEVHCKGKLLVVQHSIRVSVCQLPELPKNFVRKIGLHHFLFGRSPCNFAPRLLKTVENLIIFVFLSVNDPSSLTNAFIDSRPNRE